MFESEKWFLGILYCKEIKRVTNVVLIICEDVKYLCFLIAEKLGRKQVYKKEWGMGNIYSQLNITMISTGHPKHRSLYDSVWLLLAK